MQDRTGSRPKADAALPGVRCGPALLGSLSKIMAVSDAVTRFGIHLDDLLDAFKVVQRFIFQNLPNLPQHLQQFFVVLRAIRGKILGIRMKRPGNGIDSRTVRRILLSKFLFQGSNLLSCFQDFCRCFFPRGIPASNFSAFVFQITMIIPYISSFHKPQTCKSTKVCYNRKRTTKSTSFCKEMTR